MGVEGGRVDCSRGKTATGVPPIPVKSLQKRSREGCVSDKRKVPHVWSVYVCERHTHTLRSSEPADGAALPDPRASALGLQAGTPTSSELSLPDLASAHLTWGVHYK